MMKKIISCTLAAAMTVGALAVGMGSLSSDAASGYALGDVDMDGVITGHDSAMVSRYLNVDNTLLTDEQLALADFNGDGVVDQTDADLIHAREVYAIGAIDTDRGTVSAITAWLVLKSDGANNLGVLTVVDDGNTELSRDCYTASGDDADVTVDTLVYNLIDVNGDGYVNTLDAAYALMASGIIDLCGEEALYESGRYDVTLASQPSTLQSYFGDELLDSIADEGLALE